MLSAAVAVHLAATNSSSNSASGMLSSSRTSVQQNESESGTT